MYPQKLSLSAPASTNAGRRYNKAHDSLYAPSTAETNVHTTDTIQQDRIAWQTMSQYLTLRLMQTRRSSTTGRTDRAFSQAEAPSRYVQKLPSKSNHLKVPSAAISDKISERSFQHLDPVTLEFDEDFIEGTPALETDVHIIPLDRLIERFNSNLTNGLTDSIVEQHRTIYGKNKLTPSRPPSLIWMFITQLLIGFNGVLWLATLFAFLSYVSFLYCFY